MFAFSLSTFPKGTTTPVAPPSGFVTVNAFTRDKALFDSGIAFGANLATIPLSGTGTVGEVVQARGLLTDDGGATATAWVDVATVDGAGNWAGQITAPRSASWYRPQVRLKATPAISAQGANRFGVGHVFALWGQSEPENITSAFYGTGAVATIADPEAVQIITGAFATPPAVTHITSGATSTPQVAAMAHYLISTRPGEKFAIIFHCRNGTDPRDLVDDSQGGRLWSDDLALHNFAVADGQSVGIAAMSWFASPGKNLGDQFDEALFPLFTGKTMAGAAVSFPSTISYTGGSYTANHWFGELYDYAKTKWVAYGPHRFDITADMIDATHLVGGATVGSWVNIQNARASWRAMAASPHATMFLPRSFEPLSIENGYDDGAGSWTDLSHPSRSNDGSAAFARMSMAAILEAANLTTWNAPVFDNCLWEATGAYVEVWSSEGPITTIRKARAEAALPATFPHWTEVMGFTINGVPAQNATIVAGRVRITKNGGSNFIFSDVINYGEGGATGQIQFPEDMINQTYKNLPIVNVGAAGLDGIPVAAIPDPAVLANTLPAVTSFTTVNGQATRFQDLLNWPTTVPGGQKVSFFIDCKPLDLAVTRYLMSVDNLPNLRIELLSNGQLRLNMKDSAGVDVFAAVIIGTVSAGTRFTLAFTVDIGVSNACWVTLNGVTTQYSFTGRTTAFVTGTKKFRFLANTSGALNFVGDVYKLKVWNDVFTGGLTNPLVNTNLRTNGEIVGPAAVANAHPWRLGGAVI